MAFSKLTIKLFTPFNTSFKTEMIPAPKGMQIEDDEGLAQSLDAFCDAYANGYPGHKFAVRYIGRGKFNVVWIGKEAINHG